MTTTHEVLPIAGPLRATVDLPGSKSITNRALICASLAAGTSELQRVLVADDTHAMVDGLRSLGVAIDVVRAHDPVGASATVVGVAGRFPASEVSVDARLSGTTSRFLLAAALAADGPVRVDGGAPLRSRPMADAIDPIGALGGSVESAGGALPMTVTPPSPHSSRALANPVEVVVSGAASSQFLSGLLMVAPCLGRSVRFVVDGTLRSRPYVDMTASVMSAFGVHIEIPEARDAARLVVDVSPQRYRASTYAIEPDASAASYFWAAAAITGGTVTVSGIDRTSMQGDVAFLDVLTLMGAQVEVDAGGITVTGPPPGQLRGVEVDMADISDTVPTLAALAVFANSETAIGGVGFIRAKETDRIGSVVAELRRCGVTAHELPDGLRVEPGTPTPATIRTYDDHRMAMSFAVLGLRASGITIDDPGCVAKTFPGFWTTLDAMREHT